MTYLVFDEIKDTGKTKVWQVQNSDNGSVLGEIKWYGGWRRYVLVTEADCIWSPECLRDTSKFILDQMEARRK